MIGGLQEVNLGRQRRKSCFDLGPQFMGAMATAQMVKNHGVIVKFLGAFYEISTILTPLKKSVTN